MDTPFFSSLCNGFRETGFYKLDKFCYISLYISSFKTNIAGLINKFKQKYNMYWKKESYNVWIQLQNNPLALVGTWLIGHSYVLYYSCFGWKIHVDFFSSKNLRHYQEKQAKSLEIYFWYCFYMPNQGKKQPIWSKVNGIVCHVLFPEA